MQLLSLCTSRVTCSLQGYTYNLGGGAGSQQGRVLSTRCRPLTTLGIVESADLCQQIVNNHNTMVLRCRRPSMLPSSAHERVHGSRHFDKSTGTCNLGFNTEMVPCFRHQSLLRSYLWHEVSHLTLNRTWNAVSFRWFWRFGDASKFQHCCQDTATVTVCCGVQAFLVSA